MDDERRAQITAALRRYRETVTRHSFTLVRALVEAVEEMPAPEYYSEETVQYLRLRELDLTLGGPVAESGLVRSPRDLLRDDIRDEVVGLTGLDGVSPADMDLEGREKYFAAVRARIAELNVEVAEFPPADLAYLCTLVPGISGPGLRYHHDSQQIEFLTALEDADRVLEDFVMVPVRYDAPAELPYHQLTWVWEDWEIAVAFQIGQAPFPGGSFALYCRKADSAKQWKWRYGIHDGDWCSDVYDSVEDFLDYYAHFRGQTTEEVLEYVRNASLGN
jgi:hypothetical protein